ncbi:MAG: hypothetical protein ACUVWA_15270 [Candidatus Oleimicrobiaceae bacterium]
MTRRRKRRGPLPIHRWPLWKKVVVLGPGSLVWSSVPLLIPPYVPEWTLGVTITLFLSMFGAILWAHFRDNILARSIRVFAGYPGVFTLMASRAWLAALPIGWTWLLPLWGAVVLAALLPFVAPDISETLWREQTTPRTRVGKAFMAFLLAIGPSAGTLGAAWGMYGLRFLGEEPTMLGMAVLGSALAVGGGFIASYHVAVWRREGLQAVV